MVFLPENGSRFFPRLKPFASVGGITARKAKNTAGFTPAQPLESQEQKYGNFSF